MDEQWIADAQALIEDTDRLSPGVRVASARAVDLVRRALAAATGAQPAVHPGFMSVPIEPDTEMQIAGFECEAMDALSSATIKKKGWPYSCRQSAELVTAIFKAMCAAAPKPAATGAQADEPPRDAEAPDMSGNWAQRALLLMDEADYLIRFGSLHAGKDKYAPAAAAFWKVAHMLAAATAAQGEPVAWQERQARRIRKDGSYDWSGWYPCGDRAPDAPLSQVTCGIPYEWRPLYAAPVAKEDKDGR